MCEKCSHTTINCWHGYEQNTSFNTHANFSQFSSTFNEDHDQFILSAPSTVNDLL